MHQDNDHQDPHGEGRGSAKAGAARGRVGSMARRVAAGLGLALGGLILFAILAVVIVGPRQTVETMLRVALEQAGFAPVALTVTAVGLDAVEVADIALGPETTLSAKRVRLDFAAAGPLAGARMLVVDGLDLTMRWTDQGLDWGFGGGGRAADRGAEAPGGLPPFPITINAARLRLLTPVGDLVALTSVPALITPEGVKAALSLAFDPKAGGPFEAAPHEGMLTVGLDAALAFTLDAAFAPRDGADPALAGLTFDAKGSGDLKGGPLAVRFALSDGRVPAQKMHLGAAVLALAREAGEADTRLDFTLDRATIDAAPGSAPFALEAAHLAGRVIEEPAGWSVLTAGCADVKRAAFSVGGYALVAQGLALCPETDESAILGQAAGVLRAALRVAESELAVSTASGEALAVGRAPALALALDLPESGRGRAQLQAQGGRLTLPGWGMAVTRLSLVAEAALEDGRLGTGTLTLGKVLVSDIEQAPRFAPLTLAGTAGLAPAAAAMPLSFALEASAEGAGRIAQATGTHDLKTGAGSARLGLETLTFAKGGLAPEQLLPVLRGKVTAATGMLGGDAALAWDEKGMTSGAELVASALAFRTPWARVAGLDGRVALDSLMPLRTAKPQEISVKLLDLGLPLTDGVVRFTVEDDTLVISDAHWSWIGGTVGVASAAFGGGRAEQQMTFAVDNVDLAALLKLADVDGLSGTGRLSGRVPVTITRDHQWVKGGFLRAAAPGGTLTYRGSAAGAATGAHAGSAILFKALDDFQYNTLDTELDGDLAGALSLKVHLKGNNPALYNGYPIELNVSTEGPFVEMIRNGLFAYRDPALR